MSAKIVKKQAAAEFVPFALPELGTKTNFQPGTQKFVFPTPANMETLEEIHTSQAPQATVEDVIKNARNEAAAIIEQAEKDKEAIEQAAREKGLLEAKATVETEINQRVEAQTTQLRGQLTSTIEQVSALSIEVAEKVEKDAVELALEIAKKVVGREVSLDREIVGTMVKVALGKLHNRSVAEVHLNPEDFAFVSENREKLGFRGALELVEDNSVSVGGCLIHTETGDIDARIESQFDEIAYGLLES